MKTEYILICDDDIYVAQLTGMVLETEGYKVETAKNTAEISEKLTNDGNPAMILLDLHIPDTGGEAVVRELRSHKETQEIPIILFSGQEDLEEIAAKLQVNGYLKKPFSNNDVRRIAGEYLHRTAK